jgi:hypothetical protein
MRRLREDLHHRLLGNGHYTRPAELDCHFESICETCTFFSTNSQFAPTLQRQRDHAAERGTARPRRPVQPPPRPPQRRKDRLILDTITYITPAPPRFGEGPGSSAYLDATAGRRPAGCCQWQGLVEQPARK